MKNEIRDVLQRGLSLSLLAGTLWFSLDARAAQEPKADSQAAAETQASVASPVLSVTFDDPNQLFSAYPEGVSLLDARKNSEVQEKTVATGTGGPAKIEVGGDWDKGAGEPPKYFVLLSNPDEGIKSALRIAADKSVQGISAVIKIRPEADETWMASLSTFKDGKIFLNGGIDMFFRYSEEPAASDLVLSSLARKVLDCISESMRTTKASLRS